MDDATSNSLIFCADLRRALHPAFATFRMIFFRFSGDTAEQRISAILRAFLAVIWPLAGPMRAAACLSRRLR